MAEEKARREAEENGAEREAEEKRAEKEAEEKARREAEEMKAKKEAGGTAIESMLQQLLSSGIDATQIHQYISKMQAASAPAKGQAGGGGEGQAGGGGEGQEGGGGEGPAPPSPAPAGAACPQPSLSRSVAAAAAPSDSGRQQLDAASTLVTLSAAATHAPAPPSSPHGADAAATVNNTVPAAHAVATTGGGGGGKAAAAMVCKQVGKGSVFTVITPSGMRSSSSIDGIDELEPDDQAFVVSYFAGDIDFDDPEQGEGGPAAETSAADLSVRDSPAGNAGKGPAPGPLTSQPYKSPFDCYKTFVPLALGDGTAGSESTISDFIATDIKAMFPGVLAGNDDSLHSLCQHLHTEMMKAWETTNTGLTREQVRNLARGLCVHEEIADLFMGLLCSMLGASYLDSSGLMHPANGPGLKGRWSGHLKIDEAAAAKTLVLACSYSAQVAAGNPRFVSAWIRDATLAPFSHVLWLKAGDRHFTTVRMGLRKRPDQAVQAVEAQLADSNCEKKPALDPAYRSHLENVVKRLFPGAEFMEKPGFSVPRQNSSNDCLFHTALFQVHAISPAVGPDGVVRLHPHPDQWQRDAARLRSYFLLLVYREMQSKGARLPDLSAAHAEWTSQQHGHNASKRKLEMIPEVATAAKQSKESGPGGEVKRRACGGAARLERSGEGVDAKLRSADMGRCRLAVVHKSYWEAYRDLKKLVEFRSPRQTIPFFPGMIMLLSLNACERRKGRTELLMAGVGGIYVLSCSEAYAHFPVEARACDLESLCKRWRGNNTVQCLVLDKNSLRVASEVRNLAAGNLGLLRQINDRARPASAVAWIWERLQWSG